MTRLLEMRDVSVAFDTFERRSIALTGVNLSVDKGEVVGIVGETGCGKTLTGLSILRLLPRTASIVGGSITLDGEDVLAMSERDIRGLRGARVAMVFQNPTSAFNPVHTIGSHLRLVLQTHTRMHGREIAQRIREALSDVGMPDIERVVRSYPHQLSGGMLQRAMIAMALLLKPALLIADEPTTSLDVTIAAQVLELIRHLQHERGFSVVYITHDLGVVRGICDRVVVLYAGRDVETASTEDLFAAPAHPYTRALLAAVPRVSARGHALPVIPGIVPSDPGAMVGCPFVDRCAFAFDRCRVERPEPTIVGGTHAAACHLLTPQGAGAAKQPVGIAS